MKFLVDDDSVKNAAHLVAKMRQRYDGKQSFRWWFVEMADKDGNLMLKDALGKIGPKVNGRPYIWVLQYGAFDFPDQVMEHVKIHYCRGGIDPENFIQPLRAYATNDDPPGPLQPIPGRFTEFGCRRQHIEIKAGIRSRVDILLPPIDMPAIPDPSPMWRRGLVPTNQRGLKPLIKRA
jgi:hypothetical protein